MRAAAASALLSLSCALFLGTPSAFGEISIDLATMPVPTLRGTSAEEQFGYSCAAGDVDGDGARELIVGAPGHMSQSGAPHAGGVYVFGPEALAAPPSTVEAEIPVCLLRESTRGARFGQAVAAADLSGDGVADVVVGAPSWGTPERIGCGRVSVFFGAPSRFADSAAADAADLVLEGGTSGDGLGASILAADVDGDGDTDLLVTSPGAEAPVGRGAGAAYLVTGETLTVARGTIPVAEAAAAIIRGERPGDGLVGLACGDTDGDGAGELLLGSPRADGPEITRVDAGKVYVLRASRCAGSVHLTPGDAVAVGPTPRGFLGRSIAAADVDSDGCDDVVVSAYASRGSSDKEDATGEVFLLFGRREGLGETIDLATAGVPTFRSRSRWDLFGLPVLASDLSGDGEPDIAIAAQFADLPDRGRQRCGEVYVVRGSLRSVMNAKAGSAELADVTITGAGGLEALGVALLAAELVGDAKPDLVIGAPDAVGPKLEQREGRIYVIPGERLVGR